MSGFRYPSAEEMDGHLRAARHARSETLVAMFVRLWARLTGRAPAPASATYA